MIDSVRLINVQSHADTLLEFHPGVNVIVGASDQGKSTILRAVEWLRKNRPTNGQTELIRVDSNVIQESMRVELQINGAVVVRSRDRSGKSAYILNGELFGAFGTDVPTPITDQINMDDVNVQLQLDKHFLILETPGVAAAFVNEITKLQRVTEVVAVIRKKQREYQTQLESAKAELVPLDRLLSVDIPAKLKALNQLVARLDKLEIQRVQLNDRFVKLVDCVNRLKSVIRGLPDSCLLNTVLHQVQVLEPLFKTQIGLQLSVTQLGDLITKLHRIEDSLVVYQGNEQNLLAAMVEARKDLIHCPTCNHKLSATEKQYLLGGNNGN